MSTVADAAQGATPRAAVQIEAADLEDFQRTARLLLASPLVTERWPETGALAAVRRWQPALTNEFARVLGYRLDVGRSCARLYRRAANPSAARGARTQTDRPMGRWACSLLCLALAALEASGEQTTLSRLAEDVLRLRSGDDALPIDLTVYDQRRALVDAIGWLEVRGVITLRDGGAESWLKDHQDGDALYDVDRDTISRLLVSSPSVLRDVVEIADFCVEPVPVTDDGRHRAMHHRVTRRLLTEAVVHLDDLDPDELAYARWRRTRIVADVERLAGVRVECRAEGWLVIDAAAAPIAAGPFPGRGAVAQAALLWSTRLVAAAEPSEHRPGRLRCEPGEVEATWTEVVANYGDRFGAEHRDRPQRFRADVTTLLAHLDLIEALPDASWLISPAAARYRPTVEDNASDQLSLLDAASGVSGQG